MALPRYPVARGSAAKYRRLFIVAYGFYTSTVNNALFDGEIPQLKTFDRDLNECLYLPCSDCLDGFFSLAALVLNPPLSAH